MFYGLNGGGKIVDFLKTLDIFLSVTKIRWFDGFWKDDNLVEALEKRLYFA